jgi:uncharacterized protein (DUF488 family)
MPSQNVNIRGPSLCHELFKADTIAKSCFFHLVYDTRKIHIHEPTQLESPYSTKCFTSLLRTLRTDHDL